MNPTMKTATRTAPCPKCSTPHEFEVCQILPRIVPLCDDCGVDQYEDWKIKRKDDAWRRFYDARIPDGYRFAQADKVPPNFASALSWRADSKHGGVGIVGPAGKGKSCALACLLWTMRKPFTWWSGTEARDAAIYAATADRDRASARERWEAAMVVPILVIDDISQGKFTESWSSSLFDLLETRMGSRLPTLWTSQINLEEIRAKIVRQNGGDDAQADAISRRLAQHSLILKP
jgi:hypothetical protein